jgi:hypothetical protein
MRDPQHDAVPSLLVEGPGFEVQGRHEVRAGGGLTVIRRRRPGSTATVGRRRIWAKVSAGAGRDLEGCGLIIWMRKPRQVQFVSDCRSL